MENFLRGTKIFDIQKELGRIDWLQKMTQEWWEGVLLG